MKELKDRFKDEERKKKAAAEREVSDINIACD
jgi:hypothetical protein